MLLLLIAAVASQQLPSETCEPAPQDTPTWAEDQYSTAMEADEEQKSSYVFVSPTLEQKPTEEVENYHGYAPPEARFTVTPEEIVYTPTDPPNNEL